MPLIVMTGIPSSGKTTRTAELQKYFSDRGKVVHVISENEQIAKAGFSKNSFYLGKNHQSNGLTVTKIHLCLCF